MFLIEDFLKHNSVWLQSSGQIVIRTPWVIRYGTTDDPWCKKCLNRGQHEVENTILHSFYTPMLIAATIAYFAPGSSF